MLKRIRKIKTRIAMAKELESVKFNMVGAKVKVVSRDHKTKYFVLDLNTRQGVAFIDLMRMLNVRSHD